MNIVLVDDEQPALQLLEQAVKRVTEHESAEIGAFTSAKEALCYAGSHLVDVAFLDINMGGMNGLVLAKELKDIRGDTNIVFVTGYSEYLRNAFKIHASGFILKPVRDQDIQFELEDLRRPVNVVPDRGVHIQCFGNFEIFVNGKPVAFRRSKSREAMAYLTDRRGASVSKKELAAVLWEDETYSHSLQSHLYKLIADITESLQRVGASDIFILRRGVYALDVTKVTCDYYSYLNGEIAAVNSYQGEYMVNYSWAEFTSGELMSNVR